MFALSLQNLRDVVDQIFVENEMRLEAQYAHIIEVQPCTVYIDQNLVRERFGVRCIFREFNLGWMAELLDYEGAHGEWKGFLVNLCCCPVINSNRVSSACAEALMAGRMPAECRSHGVLDVIDRVYYANPAAALCAPTKSPYSQNPLNHEFIFTVVACQSIRRSATPSCR